MKSPKKFLRKCVRKVMAGAQVAKRRAKSICSVILHDKLARKRAFLRTKSKKR